MTEIPEILAATAIMVAIMALVYFGAHLIISDGEAAIGNCIESGAWQNECDRMTEIGDGRLTCDLTWVRHWCAEDRVRK